MFLLKLGMPLWSGSHTISLTYIQSTLRSASQELYNVRPTSLLEDFKKCDALCLYENFLLDQFIDWMRRIN